MQGYDEDFHLISRQDTIAELLKAGANPNAVNTHTCLSCLHWACYNYQDSVSVEALLESGADPFVFDFQGYTPVDIAGIMCEEDTTRTSKKEEPRNDVIFNNKIRYIRHSKQS